MKKVYLLAISVISLLLLITSLLLFTKGTPLFETLLGIGVDSNGSVYVATSANRILKYNNGKLFHTFTFNQKILGYDIEDDNLTVYQKDGMYIYSAKTGELQDVLDSSDGNAAEHPDTQKSTVVFVDGERRYYVLHTRLLGIVSTVDYSTENETVRVFSKIQLFPLTFLLCTIGFATALYIFMVPVNHYLTWKRGI